MSFTFHCSACRRPTTARDRASIATKLLAQGTPASDITMWTCPCCVFQRQIEAQLARQRPAPPPPLAVVIPIRRRA